MRLYAVVVPPIHVVDDLYHRLDTVRDESVTWEPASAVRIGLSFFGNVILADVDRLTRRLSEAVAQTTPFEVRFAGGDALAEDGDDSVCAAVEGDLDGLRALAMSTAAAARNEGFAVDRRWYRPRARIARINATTTVPALQQTLKRLGAAGDFWSVGEVTIVEVKPRADGPQMVSWLATLPLQG